MQWVAGKLWPLTVSAAYFLVEAVESFRSSFVGIYLGLPLHFSILVVRVFHLWRRATFW